MYRIKPSYDFTWETSWLINIGLRLLLKSLSLNTSASIRTSWGGGHKMKAIKQKQFQSVFEINAYTSILDKNNHQGDIIHSAKQCQAKLWAWDNNLPVIDAVCVLKSMPTINQKCIADHGKENNENRLLGS